MMGLYRARIARILSKLLGSVSEASVVADPVQPARSSSPRPAGAFSSDTLMHRKDRCAAQPVIPDPKHPELKGHAHEERPDPAELWPYGSASSPPVGLAPRFEQSIQPAIRNLYRAGVDAGEVRPGFEPAELLAAVSALCASRYKGHPSHVGRMVALLADGLRVRSKA